MVLVILSLLFFSKYYYLIIEFFDINQNESKNESRIIYDDQSDQYYADDYLGYEEERDPRIKRNCYDVYIIYL